MNELHVKTIFNLCPDMIYAPNLSGTKLALKNGVMFINFPTDDSAGFAIIEKVCTNGGLAMIQARHLRWGMCWSTVGVDVVAVGQL